MPFRLSGTAPQSSHRQQWPLSASWGGLLYPQSEVVGATGAFVGVFVGGATGVSVGGATGVVVGRATGVVVDVATGVIVGAATGMIVGVATGAIVGGAVSTGEAVGGSPTGWGAGGSSGGQQNDDKRLPQKLHSELSASIA